MSEFACARDRARREINGQNPFRPENDEAYGRWRAQKLAEFPNHIDELVVPVNDLAELEETELEGLLKRCAKANMAIYTCNQTEPSKRDIRRLGLRLGLNHLDANLGADGDRISSVCVMPHGVHRHYIPYTNRGLNWHTDGYYNSLSQPIRAFIMHCVRPAARGGANAFLDPEIVYIALRDENPDYVSILMDPSVMTVPANNTGGTEIRPAQTGPVFAIDADTGALHMRYTARLRSIVWKQDVLVTNALKTLATILREDTRTFRIRLKPGYGVVCNNILHSRNAFSDTGSGKRLLYRARYYDRIGTPCRMDTQ